MKHLVFDTETTALIENSARALAKQPRIFEIAGIIWDDGVGNMETLHHWQVDPGAPISKASTKKTGVTDAMVRGRPLFRQCATAVQHMLDEADVAVAHNLSFDKAMVDLEFHRLGVDVAWPSRLVCTIEHTEHLQGMRLNLGALHRLLFNEDFSGAHGAVADARATLRCYRELLKRGEIVHERQDQNRL